MYVLPYSTKHIVETRGDPTFALETTAKPEKIDKTQWESDSLYETLIKKPCDSFAEALRFGKITETVTSETSKKIRFVEYILNSKFNLVLK